MLDVRATTTTKELTMPLRGTAFLAIWNDVAVPAETEWNVWHTEEHMPERAAVPGFLMARRYVDRSRDHHRYFTLYETRALEVLNGSDYVTRLNTPTAWTRKMMPHFQNFMRGAVGTVSSLGDGIGGAITTWRLTLADPAAGIRGEAADTLVAWALEHGGVVGAHIGVADAAVTAVPTRERELRSGAADEIFDAVVLIEAIGRRELEGLQAELSRKLTRWCAPGVGVWFAHYHLQYALDGARERSEREGLAE